MSLKGTSTLNSALNNVRELVDTSKDGAVFQIKNSAPEVGFKTVGYVPKEPVVEYLKSKEAQHKSKIDQYKNYASSLKERYQKYETESQRHYANVIKSH